MQHAGASTGKGVGESATCASEKWQHALDDQLQGLQCGVNLQDGDLHSAHGSKASSVALCRTACKRHAHCQAFTFITAASAKQRCWLKERGYVREASGGTVSWERASEERFGDVDAKLSNASRPRSSQGVCRPTLADMAAVTRPFAAASDAVAVCVRGQWGSDISRASLHLTAPRLREHVLEPLGAYTFAVLESQDASIAANDEATRECERLLGRRASSCIVQVPKCLYLAKASAFFDSSQYNATTQRLFGDSGAKRAVRAMALQRYSCLELIKARRTTYRAYASIRADLVFFSPLPQPLVQQIWKLTPRDAIVPTGDDWGGLSCSDQQTPNCTLNDNLLFGGWQAFRAEALQWQILRDDHAYFSTERWNPERLHGYALQQYGQVNLTRVPIAYCKATATGACRYFGQLATSMTLEPDLLDRHPEAAARLCQSAPGPCSRRVTAANSSSSTFGRMFQTAADRQRDRFWCNLIREVANAHVCSSWGGNVRLAHRL